MLTRTAFVLVAALATSAVPLEAQEPAAPQPPGLADVYRMLEEQRALIERQAQELAELKRRLDLAEQRGVGSQARSTTVAEAAPSASPAAATPQQAANAGEDGRPELQRASGGMEFPGAFDVPGTPAKLRIGGQVRTLLVRNLGAVGTEDRFVTSSIAVKGTPEADKTSRTTLSATPSRFNLDLRTPTSRGALRAFIEGDFAGDGKTYRLRHAFGQWHGLLAGQTWSTFSDPEAEPDGIDFEGLNAISLFRQPQVRWTHPVWRQTELAIALENPAPDLTGATGVNQVPDVVVRLRFEPKRVDHGLGRLLRTTGHVQFAYLVRQIRGEPIDNANQVLSTGGTGYHVSGRLPAPWLSRDFVTFASALGTGIGRYITDLGSEGGQDAVYDPTRDELRPLNAFSWYVGYEHWWTSTLRSTGTYGYVRVKNLDVQADDALHRTGRSSVNLAWSPLPRVDLVSEFLVGRRVDKDGREGTAGQVQVGWTFRF